MAGYASDIYEMLKTPIKNKDDDQMYYTKAFLDKNIRTKLKIKLDYESDVFQNLNGATADVRITYNEATGEYFVRNIMTDTVPSVIHGNGPSKVLLNNFGTYVAGAFKHNECQLCQEKKLDYSTVSFIFKKQNSNTATTIPYFFTYVFYKIEIDCRNKRIFQKLQLLLPSQELLHSLKSFSIQFWR